MKEAPAQALRAVFAGIGHALLVSDRVRRRLKSAPGADGAPQKAAPDTVRIPVTRPTAVKTAAEAPSNRTPKPPKCSAAKAAGKARRAPAKATAAPAARPPQRPQPKRPATSSRRRQSPRHGGRHPRRHRSRTTTSFPSPHCGPGCAGLDVAQVRQLLSYEKARGSRSDVITMYERRIAKLTEADG